MLMEKFCIFMLPVVLIFVGSGNVLVIDQSVLVLWMLLTSHYIVIILQR